MCALRALRALAPRSRFGALCPCRPSPRFLALQFCEFSLALEPDILPILFAEVGLFVLFSQPDLVETLRAKLCRIRVFRELVEPRSLALEALHLFRRIFSIDSLAPL